ncbi:MAG: methyltransferase domain-containing protein [bacterium]|nr:methyltransferase domain-containing protein [bacterium]
MRECDRVFIADNIELFLCPQCGGDLVFDSESLSCSGCGQTYAEDDGISSLFWPNEWDPAKEDVTARIKSFYEKTPFPNYDDFDNVGSLIAKARRGLFAKLLDDQVPAGTRILECGCGTGQLTNFLSIANRTVIGTDICLNSLKMGSAFRDANDLKRAHFIQMNLFRPAFKPRSFDLVISNGVLHHTSDPLLAFKSIANLVKPNGYILIGLYHKYGRLATDLRRVLFRLTRDRMKFLDQRTISGDISQAKRDSWFNDQYKNPHESKHTVGEVLGWLEETNFKFVHSLPKTVPFENIDHSERLFQPDRLGNLFERLIVNLGMIVTGHKEGGFFIVIARKMGD